MITPAQRHGKSVVKLGMRWIYLSPHLDDVAFSCGALLFQQAQDDNPSAIWTICAGDPPQRPLSDFAQELHARWQTGPLAAQRRRQEDIAACQILSADYRHLSLPDCIYRYHPQTGQALYSSEQAIFGSLHPADTAVLEELVDDLQHKLPPDCELVCPLTLGGHVDHLLTRQAAERLQRPLWYYADFPYLLKAKGQMGALLDSGWEKRPFALSADSIEAWVQSIAAHASQISTFWPDLESLRAAIQEVYQQYNGIPLWNPPHQFVDANAG